MRLVRRFLQVVLGLFCLILILPLLRNAEANWAMSGTLLGIFGFFILLLGPLWPGGKKTENEKAPPAVEKPRMIPRPYVVYPLLAIFLLLLVLSMILNPDLMLFYLPYFVLPSLVGLVLGVRSKEQDWNKPVWTGFGFNGIGLGLGKILKKSMDLPLDTVLLVAGSFMALGFLFFTLGLVRLWHAVRISGAAYGKSTNP